MDHLTIKNLIKVFSKNFSLLLTENMLYPPQHPNVIAQTKQTIAAAESAFNIFKEIHLDIREGQFVFEGIPLYELKHIVQKTTQILESKNIHGIRFTKDLTPQELSIFAGLIADKSRALDAEGLQKELGKMNIFNISVEKKPSLTDDDKDNFLAPNKIYSSSVEANKLIYNTLLKEDSIPMDVVDKVAQDITNIIIRNKTSSLALTSLRDYDDYTFTHSTNVAILAVTLASNILNNTEILNHLARATLLHDIGKTRIPQEILHKPGKLTKEEWQLIRKHPILGVKILEQQEEVNKLAVVIACQHHMKYDLSGYPKLEASCSLHPLALIVNICDVYDAITSKRSYKNPFPPDKALSIMMRLIGCDFEPQLLKIFTQMIGVYPPGTLVRLNTKELALTTKVQVQALLLPEIKIIADASGSILEEPLIINLNEQQGSPKRSIETVLEPKEEGIDILSYI